MTYECDFLIVGGGASAVAILAQFVKIRPQRPFRIMIIEKKSRPGPGFPYDKNVLLQEHLVNIAPGCINITSTDIRYSEISDFLQWLETSPLATAEMFQAASDPYEKVVSPPPRWIVGEYMTERFQTFVTECRNNGLQIDVLTNTAAINIESRTGGYEIDLANGDRIRTIDVFLATGHWEGGRFPEVDGYFGSPWPACKLQNEIPGNEHIGIFGSNLSGVDAVLSLSLKFGRFERNAADRLVYRPHAGCGNFKMTIYSRSGQLPEVMGVVVNKVFTHKHLTGDRLKSIIQANNGFLPLDTFFHLFKTELVDQEPSFLDIPGFWEMRAEDFMAYMEDSFGRKSPKERLAAELHRAKQSIKEKKPIPHQNVFYQSLTVFDEAFQYFSAEDAIRFKKDVAPTLHKLVGPIVIKNGEILLALMNAGRLDLEAVKTTCKVVPSNDNVGIYLQYEKDGLPVTAYHRYFIDALGQSGDIESDASPLTQSMLRNRLVQPLYIPFRNQALGKMAYVQQVLSKHGPKKIICEKDAYYYKSFGIAMDMSTSRVLSPDAIAGEDGVIYASGPFIYGHFAFPQDLSVVTTCAERTVEDVEARHGLGDSLAAVTKERRDWEQNFAKKAGLTPNAKGYLSADMREMTRTVGVGNFN